jgi:hypothetical protein
MNLQILSRPYLSFFFFLYKFGNLMLLLALKSSFHGLILLFLSHAIGLADL